MVRVTGFGYSYPVYIRFVSSGSFAVGCFESLLFMRASLTLKSNFAGKCRGRRGHPDNPTRPSPKLTSPTLPICVNTLHRRQVNTCFLLAISPGVDGMNPLTI